MNKIEIFEQDLKKNGNTMGKIVILISAGNIVNQEPLLDTSVSTYIGNIDYNECVEIHHDNPFDRV